MSTCDDFIRSTGHLAFVNLFLKYAVFILGLVCLGLVACLLVVSRRAGEVTPLPIYINTITGEAKPVDFRAVDAGGRERQPVEVEAFVREYLGSLYTYTRLTVKANLEDVFGKTVPGAQGQVKLLADLPGRADLIAKSGQGLCRIQAVSILEAQPNIAVQAIFRKVVIAFNDETILDDACTAILRLKVVGRTVANAHGLVVVEYNESKFKEETR